MVDFYYNIKWLKSPTKGFKMNTDTLVLRSTLRGYVTILFWLAFWFGLVIWFNRWAVGFLDAGLSAYDVRIPFLWMGVVVSYVTIPILILTFLWYMLYGPREVNTLTKGSEGVWDRIVCVSYGFLFSKRESTRIINRIIKVAVEQPTISRMLGVGTLEIEFSTFVNGEAEESSWTIPAIDNPYAVKDTILKHSALHRGVDVRLSRNFDKIA